MRTHEIVVATLHLLCALFVGGIVALLWFFAAALSYLVAGTFVPELVAMFGRPIAIFLLVVAALDGLAAVALMTGSSRWARMLLIVTSLPLLTVFPIGTAIAGYSLWTLIRRPASQPVSVPEPAALLR